LVKILTKKGEKSDVGDVELCGDVCAGVAEQMNNYY
jgi:hypothetical protein